MMRIKAKKRWMENVFDSWSVSCYGSHKAALISSMSYNSKKKKICCNLLLDWFWMFIGLLLLLLLGVFIWVVVRLTPLINGQPHFVSLCILRFVTLHSNNNNNNKSNKKFHLLRSFSLFFGGVLAAVWDLWPFKMQLNLIEARKKCIRLFVFFTLVSLSLSLS